MGCIFLGMPYTMVQFSLPLFHESPAGGISNTCGQAGLWLYCWCGLLQTWRTVPWKKRIVESTGIQIGLNPPGVRMSCWVSVFRFLFKPTQACDFSQDKVNTPPVKGGDRGSACECEHEWPQCLSLLCFCHFFFFTLQKVCILHAGKEFINFNGEFKYLNETIALLFFLLISVELF